MSRPPSELAAAYRRWAASRATTEEIRAAKAADVLSYWRGKKRVRASSIIQVLIDLQMGLCAICGLPMRADPPGGARPDQRMPTIDHIVARADGGDSSRNNLQAAHALCNNRKGSKIGGSHA